MDLDKDELRATRKMHGLDYKDEEDNQEKEKKEEKDGNQV